MPKVSVIIPTYNREQFILRAIDSVLKQTFTDYEIIVIDDGSKDSTRQILEPYMGKIKYHYQENAGISAARNKGIFEAKGEYLAFLDSDDTWVPEKLALQVAILEKNRKIGLVFCKMNRIDENGRICGTKPEKFTGINFKELIINWGDIPTSTVLLRRECIDKVGYFDESLETMEDFELWLRIAEQFDLEVISDKNLADYYHHAEQITKKPIHVYEGYIKLQKKLLSYYQNSPAPIINKRIAESEYVLSRIYYDKRSYRQALSLLYSSLCRAPFISFYFMNVNDSILNRIFKFFKPYFYILICSVMAATRLSSKNRSQMPDKKQPFISIIVPVYNRVKYLEQAVDSILNQNYTDFEIIIVDDGSTEDIRETLIKCSNKAPSKIRFLKQANKGPAGARNKGIREAKGKYIAFLDSDDIWEKDFLNKCTQILRSGKYKWLDTSAFRVVINDQEEETQKTVIQSEPIKNVNELYPQLLKDNVIGSPSKVIIEKACFEKAGYFREDLRIREDWEMWLRLAKSHFEYCRILEPLYQYKIRQNSLTKTETLQGLKGTYVLLSDYSRDAFRSDPANRTLYAEMMWGIARHLLSSKQKDHLLFVKSIFKSQSYDPSLTRVMKSLNSILKR